MPVATPNFKDFTQRMQVGAKGFLSLRSKAAIRQLAKTDPLAKQAIFGRQLTRRQTLEYGKKLKEIDSQTFTQRSVHAVYNEMTREAQAKERLDTPAAQKDTGSKKEDWETRLAKKKEEAERTVLEKRAEAHAVAAGHREAAKEGRIQEAKHAYASNALKKMQEEDPIEAAKHLPVMPV